jgi:GntR family transcriptional regulator of arabinose operon
MRVNMTTNNIRKPKYVMIIEYIKEKIRNGEFNSGDKIPSETELMPIFNVSRIVVVKSLNQLASEGLVNRIPGKGTFVKSENLPHDNINIPIGPVSDEFIKKQVALIIPIVIDNFSIMLTKHITEFAFQNNIICTIFYSHNNIEMEEELIKFVLHKKFDGIILYPSDQQTYNKELFKIVNSNFPVVLIDRDLVGLGISCVQSDNENAAQKATSYLLDLGHTKIAICSKSMMPTSSVSDRIDGFILEMRNHNVLIDPTLILTGLSDEDMYRKLNDIVKNKLATAILCISYSVFEEVIDIIKINGFEWPSDFSIITFDGINTCRYCNLKPTYILQDIQGVAENAVSLIKEIIDTKISKTTKIKLASTLIEGESTAPLRKSNLVE